MLGDSTNAPINTQIKVQKYSLYIYLVKIGKYEHSLEQNIDHTCVIENDQMIINSCQKSIYTQSKISNFNLTDDATKSSLMITNKDHLIQNQNNFRFIYQKAANQNRQDNQINDYQIQLPENTKDNCIGQKVSDLKKGYKLYDEVSNLKLNSTRKSMSLREKQACYDYSDHISKKEMFRKAIKKQKFQRNRLSEYPSKNYIRKKYTVYEEEQQFKN